MKGRVALDKDLVISDVKALRALASTLRLRVLHQLQADGEASATQLARSLGEPAPKIDYHLKQLERHGFVVLVRVRQIGGLRERFYAPASRDISIQVSAGQPQAELGYAALSDIRRRVASMIREDIAEMAADERTDAAPPLYYGVHYLTPDKVTALSKQVNDLLERYSERKRAEGLVRCNIAFMLAVKSEELE